MVKNLKNIKSLFLISGSYLLQDKKGSSLLLNINYHKGDFDSVLLGESSILKKEAEILAKDLIKRKSGVNLVE